MFNSNFINCDYAQAQFEYTFEQFPVGLGPPPHTFATGANAAPMPFNLMMPGGPGPGPGGMMMNQPPPGMQMGPGPGGMGMNQPPAGGIQMGLAGGNVMSDWTEHKSPDGRSYYYNKLTNQSSWEKPVELKTPTEKLLGLCPWKEYTSDDGKKYFHNVNSQESVWTIPPELESLKSQIAFEEQQRQFHHQQSLLGINMQQPPLTQIPLPHAAPMNNSSMEMNKLINSSMSMVTSSDNAMAMAADSSNSRKDDSDDDESSSDGESKDTVPTITDKKELQELFKDLLKTKNIHSSSSWDQACKIIGRDSRYKILEKNTEKKQMKKTYAATFNSYKVQKQKDEKEETRIKAKKAKETLEQFLLHNEKMTSITKYYKCEEMFGTTDVWKAVPESDKRDIYEDAIILLAKKEREDAKNTKKRNMKKLADLLEGMPQIQASTLWSEAQQMLLENSTFFQDRELLAMDKEDALITYEKHIKDLEKEEDEEKELEKKRKRRIERKNRDAFIKILDELHEHGKLTSMSLWIELYPLISADTRFTMMLGQTGSSPLDLFKFYVEDLKSRYNDEKKLIKEILKEKEFEVTLETTFEDFATIVCEDKRASMLDAGNVKLTYNSLQEKAETKAKEKEKEEAKRIKLLASEINIYFKELKLNYQSRWEDVKPLIEDKDAYVALGSDDIGKKIFDDYIHVQDETCGHHHHSVRKTKKNKKHKKRADSSSSESLASDSEDDKKKKKSKKGRRRRSESRSDSDQSSSDSEYREKSKKKSKKSKKKKKKRTRSTSGSSFDESDKEDRGDKKKSSKDSTSKISKLRGGSVESAELSETELEKQRAILLKELQMSAEG